MDVQQVTHTRCFRWNQNRCSRGKEQLHITTESVAKLTMPFLWDRHHPAGSPVPAAPPGGAAEQPEAAAKPPLLPWIGNPASPSEAYHETTA